MIDGDAIISAPEFIAASAKICNNTRCTCFGSNYAVSPRFIITREAPAVIA